MFVSAPNIDVPAAGAMAISQSPHFQITVVINETTMPTHTSRLYFLIISLIFTPQFLRSSVLGAGGLGLLLTHDFVKPIP